MNKLYITTPEGEMVILIDSIVAYHECYISGLHGKNVLCKIYVRGIDNPFNCLEPFDYIDEKIK